MTAKEYLKQAYRLDHRINSDLEEVAQLRGMAMSISSPAWGEKGGSGSRNTEPSFVRNICKIMELEEKVNAEIDLLVDLKAQIHEVISTLTNMDEQMVLRYRYIQNMTWEAIGDELHADKSTVRRWHGEALAHVALPENPIVIAKVDTE